jgi:hypothetical protein
MAYETVAAQALTFLQQLVDPGRLGERPSLIASLRPRHSDYTAIFVPEAAAQAERSYEQWLWSAPVVWPIRPEQTCVHIRAAVSSDALIARAPEASALPGGYRDIATQLQPGVVFISFEFQAPYALQAPYADSGLYFDGLIRRVGRWIWCPNPWRACR